MDNRSPQLTDTPQSHGGWWAGPSWLISASSDDRATAFAASGYLERLWRWEHRFPALAPSGSLDESWPSSDDATICVDPDALLGSRSWISIELEVVEDSMTGPQLSSLLESVLGADSGSVLEAMAVPPVPPNANRPLFTEQGHNVVDLLLPTLPSRRGNHDLPLCFGSRRARLIAFSYGHVVIWGSIDGPWDPEVVRWPHHGVPSRSATWEANAFATPMAPNQRMHRFLEDCCGHTKYQLGTWGVEQELWEHYFFSDLAGGPSTFSGLTLGRHQQELAALAEFLGVARQAQRAILRRPAIDPALAAGEIRAFMASTGEELDDDLCRGRDVIRESFALLSNVAAGEQNLLAEQQRDATNRLQGLITVATTVLLVPALIVSVYGANIRELSPDSSGDLWGLLLLMVCSSIAATVAVRAATGQALVPRRWALPEWGVCGVAATVAIVAATAAAAGWLGDLAALSIGGVGVVTAVAAAWSATRNPRGETHD